MYEVKNGILHLNNLNLTSLDELPLDVRQFYCRNNNLTSLPELPESLKTLSCKENHLTSLHELPLYLHTLNCRNNILTYLPELPKSLYLLNCRNNILTYLPELPKRLVYLYCYNNPLECLIPKKFLIHNSSHWLHEYYYPYIESYEGQKNILTNYPNQCGELIKQTMIHSDIKKEFSYLIKSYELNLL